MFASAPNIAANGEWRIISIVFQTKFNTTLRWNGNSATMSVNLLGPSFFGPMGDSTGSGGGIAGADGVPNGNLLTANCDFAEAIVYDTLLTDSEILAVENYLADKYNISITTGFENPREEIIPEQFTLLQNYPNPFNPSTTIKFQVPNSSFVNLKVYDILGRKVATLVNEEKPVGSYEVNFDASQLSSGIYFYKLQAGSYVETKKMTLLR
ncbi:MAG: T9SS type A sorting domain-containing protein [Ignavibacteriales bacterium]|nr:T9SS type A sorting domain-containing protein [Ignavibacteriales bacterium]